ncbi:MAG TPA: cytochrome c oxidase assembly protein [Burkholderiales bacterium]|nr:cytochrome c oxidase assembly protein [Burkholderiales bacterium]
MHALTVLLLGAGGGLYAAGVFRLWRKAGRGRGITGVNATCFALGWLTVALALLSPLHHYAEELLWAHMVQHELLMVVAAPLFMASRPLEACAWVAAGLARQVSRLRDFLSNPVLAWTLHAIAVLLWHVPAVFLAAVSEPWLHFAQHASFFGTALLFWWIVLDPRANPLGAVLALLTTMMYTGGLGALMSLSRASWYAGYALEDQQLAGLVMWVPAGLAYPAAAIGLLFRRLGFAKS